MSEISRFAPRRSKAGVRRELGVEPVMEMARCLQLIALVSRALGPASFPFREILFEKTPASNWRVVWHQVTRLPVRERREIAAWGGWSAQQGIPHAHAPASLPRAGALALRIDFDESTPDNGQPRVLPGTHGRGALSDDAIHEKSATVSAVEWGGPERWGCRHASSCGAFLFEITKPKTPSGPSNRVRSF